MLNENAAQSCNVGNYYYPYNQLNPYWFPNQPTTNPQPWVTDYTITTTNILPDALNKPMEVHICVNRERQKKHDGKVYMVDGTEFSIEVFNPNTQNVGMKVSMDGEFISESMILIRAGQRLNLERFIDTNNRFKFTTYEVGTSNEIKAAIAKNGQIVLHFYKVYSVKNEKPKQDFSKFLRKRSNEWFNGYKGSNLNNLYQQDINSANTYNLNQVTMDGMGNLGDMTLNCFYSTSMETGQVDKGSSSSQSFQNVYMEYDEIASQTIYIQILPLSQKPIHKADLYKCGNCKTKYKKNDKYCSNCGQKL